MLTECEKELGVIYIRIDQGEIYVTKAGKFFCSLCRVFTAATQLAQVHSFAMVFIKDL